MAGKWEDAPAATLDGKPAVVEKKWEDTPSSASAPPIEGGAVLPPKSPVRKPFSQPMPSATAALPSVLEGVTEGITDIPVNLNRFASHLLPFKGLTDYEDKFAQDRQKRIEKENTNPGRGGMDVPRMVGNLIGTAPVAAVAGPSVAGAAAAGAGSAVLSHRPSEKDKGFWWETGKEVLEGGVGGAAGGTLAKGLSQTVGPTFSAAKDLLLRSGVQLTPGQMSRGASRVGDALSRGEGSLASVPLVGSEVRHAEAQSLATFNRASWNRALAPLGMEIPNNIPMGREAAQWVSDQMQTAYNRIYPYITVRSDPAFQTDLQSILRRAKADLPDPQYNQLERILHEQGGKLGPGGRATGEIAKGIDAELGNQASSRFSDPSRDVRSLGGFLQDTLTAWRGTMMRSSPPDIQTEMKAANEAYANYVRVMRASAATGAQNGVFTPAQLFAAVRASDPSLRKMSTARGTAKLQDIADAGRQVLPSVVRDSGTPERALWFGLLGGGANVSPETAMVLGAATAPYTAPGRMALNAWARPGPTRAAAARQLAGSQPFAGAAGGTATQLPFSGNVTDAINPPVPTP